jgi:hypothetical protein
MTRPIRPPSSILLPLALFLLFGGAAPARAQTAWPRIAAVTPPGGRRGTTVELTITGANLDSATGLLFEGAGLTVDSLTPPKPVALGAGSAAAPKKPEGRLIARVRIAPDAEPGIRGVRVLTPQAPSQIAWFVVGQWPEVAEKEPNNRRDQAQEVLLPVTVNGGIDPAEDVDFFRFHARAGQMLVFEVLAARLGSPLDSILSLQDASGRELAVNDDFNGPDSLLAFTVPTNGEYFLSLRDLRNQGSGSHIYRLSMGEIPYVTAVFPMGGRPGATVPLELDGFNLGRIHAAAVTLPADAVPGPLPVTLALPTGASNLITLAVGEAPEVTEVEPNDDPARAQLLPVPVTVNGRIQPPAASSSPDVDCYRFRAAKGDKLVLEVIAHRLGSELDSVLAVMDAAGNELAANDDSVGKDSRLEFTAPATGEYIARITDLQDRGGPGYTYRFCITPATPDFSLSFTPDRLVVGRGGRIPLTVTARRLNGFEGEIAVEVAGLPEGVSVLGPARIHAGRNGARLVLTAAPGAAAQVTSFGVTGTATIDGQTVRRRAQGISEPDREPRPVNLLTAAAVPPPDIVVTAAADRLTLSPGHTAEIMVKIARDERFKGVVSLAVLGLPDGVTADTPSVASDKTEGKVTLKAEERAAPGETEIMVAGQVAVDGIPPAPQVTTPITLAVGPAAKKP